MAALFVYNDSWTDISTVSGAGDSDSILIQNLDSNLAIFTSESATEPAGIDELENVRRINRGQFLESSGRAAGVKLWGRTRNKGSDGKARYSVEVISA